jgi:superfamily II DNA or RNA helicase
MDSVQIDVYSHGICVSNYLGRAYKSLQGYLKRHLVIEKDRNPDFNYYKPPSPSNPKMINVIKKTFAVRVPSKRILWFHRHQLDELINHLKGDSVQTANIKIIEHAAPEYDALDFCYIDEREARDEQIPQYEYLCREDLRTKILELQTGKGKTFTANKAIGTINKRVFQMLTRDSYIKKWQEDLRESFDFNDDELKIIRGTKPLADLIAEAKEGTLTAKWIICSTKTINTYITKYENGEDVIEEYGCEPIELFKILRVGVRFIDEVHEHFETIYKMDCLTNVSETISLTATLIDDNELVERMMDVMFPKAVKPPKSEYDKYINVTSKHYRFANPYKTRIKYKQIGRKSYSHVQFEKSLLKSKRELQTFTNQLLSDVNGEYLMVRDDDSQKLIIFASTVAMCTHIVKSIKTRYPKEQVRKYTSEDDYTILMNSTIIVSTLLSAGTAVDIPGLRVALMTVAIGSRRQNVQALGRLRRMRNYPGVSPRFIYYVNDDIPEHIRYHQIKRRVFSNKTLTHTVVQIPMML